MKFITIPNIVRGLESIRDTYKEHRQNAIREKIFSLTCTLTKWSLEHVRDKLVEELYMHES